MYDNPNRLVAERLRKRNELLTAGVDPYPTAAYAPSHTIPQVWSDARAMVANGCGIRVAGRVTGRRNMGKVVFLDLLDDGATLQAFVRRPTVGEQAWHIVELLDLGDFLGVEGKVFYTRTGELSVMADAISILAKASHPIPLPKLQGEQGFGAVADKGMLYRHRHVDLVCNSASRDVFIKRSRIIRAIRRYLDEAGFIEVETPIIGAAYGGAAARPFVTQVNALDEQMFLRISPECALKRCICGGINKVYELGKNFRNEGVDASHTPEFTMVEWYEAYSDYLEQMVRFETLVAGICEEINGTTKISYRGRPLDLTPPWRRLPMLQGLRDFAGLDLDSIAVEDMPAIFERHHPSGSDGVPTPLTWGTAVVALFEALVEPELWGPVFIINHPLEVSPLTKLHREDARLVERFEPIIGGMEVGNSYSELNDPVEQYNRLAFQQVSRADAYALDEDFLQAIAQGMPPAGGTGMGVDRIVMLLTGAESIRDVVFFPLVGKSVSALAGGSAPVD